MTSTDDSTTIGQRLASIESKLEKLTTQLRRQSITKRRESVDSNQGMSASMEFRKRNITFGEFPQPTHNSPPAVSGSPNGTLPQPPTEPRGAHRAVVLSPRMSVTDGSAARRAAAAVSKREVAATKQKRAQVFDPLIATVPWNDIPKMSGVKCVWLNCIALGASYVSGVDIAIDEVMKVTNSALHYVALPSVTLAELYDVTHEFLSNDSRMIQQRVRVETAVFEPVTLDDAEELTGTGDRPPIQTLAQFRKEMSEELANPNSIYIFNYDPFLVQEAEAQMIEDLADEEEEMGEDAHHPIPVPSSPGMKQFQAKNQGNFAILTSYNPALHTVTISTPHLNPDGKFVLENHVCALQTLFESTLQKDGYTKRSRGFIRIYKDAVAEVDNGSADQAIPSMFPITVLDGRNAKGQISIALDVNIAPHLLALGLLHHLAQSKYGVKYNRAAKAEDAKVKRVELGGINVSHICKKLRLPLSIICAPGRRESLPLACAWYQHYLKETRLHQALHVGFIPITRRDDSEDGALSVSEEEFFELITAAVASGTLVLIGMNVNVAQNIPLLPSDAAAHFAIVIGIDEHRGIVQLADTNVKKYRKVWHLPIIRLFTAAIGYGFMMVSNVLSDVDKLDGVNQAKKLLESGRHKLPPRPDTLQFEFPTRNYSITVLTHALNRLGLTCRVEHLLYYSGFHVSFLLSEHIPLLDVARILTYYSHVQRNDSVAVLATNLDSPDALTLEAYRALIKGVCNEKERTTQIVVNYDAPTIHRNTDIWNGSAGGSLAIVVAYDSDRDVVTLCDSNPESFYRNWDCPLPLLYKASTMKDKISDRSRGFLRISKQKSDAYNMTKKIDMRSAMSHHPFKPVISAPAACIALAFSELTRHPYSCEDVLYSNPDFNLSKLTADMDADHIAADATAFAKSADIKATATKLSKDSLPVDQIRQGLAKETALDIVIYHIAKLFGDSLASGGVVGAGIVAKMENETITVVDGNPTRFGAQWQVPLTKLAAATVGLIRIEVGANSLPPI